MGITIEDFVKEIVKHVQEKASEDGHRPLKFNKLGEYEEVGEKIEIYNGSKLHPLYHRI